jgi:REP element-mobilizing transposase RayT
MARKLRLEYPGALYHVINRGNYRSWIFADEATRSAFDQCLFDACERSGWSLHAFVTMANHFHLAVETPQANLVDGMQWLQSTFANRFNRLRNVHGHLFQGRYKALLLEPGAALGAVCHYIHLNPVRAGIVAVNKLTEYLHGSYWYLHQPKQRHRFLHMETALADAGELGDTPTGRQSYQRYLEWQAAEGPAGKTKAYVNLSRGWALGSPEFKASLVMDHNLEPLSRAWEIGGAGEINRVKWSGMLNAAMAVLGKTSHDVASTSKSTPWKLAIATWMKSRSLAGNRWLSQNLNLGAPAAASRNISRYQKELRRAGPDCSALDIKIRSLTP